MRIKNILKIILIFVFFEILYPNHVISKSNTQGLKANIDSYLSRISVKQNVSVYLESLSTNYSYSSNAGKKVPAASLIKIPVMVTVMEQVKNKKLSLDEKIVLTEKDKTAGSGLLKNYKSGTEISIRDLTELMITESDNTATNILIKKSGMENINSYMKALALKNTKIELLLMDLKAYSQGKNNYTSALDISLVLKKIYQKKLANPELCNLMIEILKKTKNRKAIPKYLVNIEIAHKTGSLLNIQGDAGIIYTKYPFILSIFVEKMPPEQADKIIADIARISYQCFQ